jgi:hypothetical protein
MRGVGKHARKTSAVLDVIEIEGDVNAILIEVEPRASQKCFSDKIGAIDPEDKNKRDNRTRALELRHDKGTVIRGLPRMHGRA